MEEQKKSDLLKVNYEEVTKEFWGEVEKIRHNNPLVRGVVWALKVAAPTVGRGGEDQAAFAKNALNVAKKMNSLWATVKNPEHERLKGVDTWEPLQMEITQQDWSSTTVRRTYGHMIYGALNREITKYATAALIDGGAQLAGYDEHGKKLPTLTVTVAKKLLNEVHRMLHAPLADADEALACLIEMQSLIIKWKEKYKF